MKKYFLTIVIALIVFTGFSQGTYITPLGHGSGMAINFEKRVLDSAGIYSNNIYAHEADRLYSLGLTPTFAMYPAGKADGKLMSQIPTDGSGDFDVIRASTASYINEDGKIATAAINEPCFDFSDGKPVLLTEDAGENLLTHPLTISDFTQSGAELQGDPSTAGAEQYTGFTNFGVGWTDNGDSTYSFDGLQTSSSDLSQGMGLGSNKLWKCEVTISGWSAGYIRLNVGGYNKSKYLRENGTFTVYVRNWNNLQNGRIYITASKDFDGTVSNISVKEVQGFAAPSVDYPTGALKLVEDGSNSSHFIYSSNVALTLNNNTLSIYAKKDKNDYLWIGFYGYSLTYTWFNLSNGTIEKIGNNIINSKIEPLSNGWYRCSITYLTNAANYKISIGTSKVNNLTSYQGDGTSGIYIAFPQLEENSFASSWMFSGTEGTTSLRSADNIGLSQYSDLPNSDFTMYWEGTINEVPKTKHGCIFSYGKLTNSYGLNINKSDNSFILQAAIRGTSTKSIAININNNIPYKVVFIYKGTGDSYVYINGELKYSKDLTGSGYIADVTKTLNIGGSNQMYGGSGYNNEKTNSAMIFKRALTETEAIELTTP